ncbi:MAG: hypothetical protein KW802_01570, partial [Candidatus Doudnabacteria bacterium]|nr:hypothetical protein [Candidatus Doudnabacteria bacterium]
MIVDPHDRAQRVQQVYTDLNRKFEEEETQRKAQQQNIPYLNLYGYPVDVLALKLLPRQVAEQYSAVVFYKEGRNIKLGIVDSNPSVMQVLKQLTGQAFTVEPYLISKSSFNHIFSFYANVISTAVHEDSIKLASTNPKFQIGGIVNLSQHIATASATETLEELVGSALHIDASNIHVEPEKTMLKIRFRIDGVLQDVAAVSSPS